MQYSKILWHLFAFASVQLSDPAAQSRVDAQFIQGYDRMPNSKGGIDWFYRPTLSDPPKQCVQFEQKVFFLEYNCAYMREICRNADAFMGSARGRQYYASTSTYFGYDFNTGKKGRSSKRRAKACPTGKRGWITYHKCPEGRQEKPMRHDGEWPYLDLDPKTSDGRTIQHKRDARGKIIQKSQIRYSCDEFPPATWVEGGHGNGVPGNYPFGGDSHTRCAAISCGKGVKAEQNWQGAAHGRLRELLKKAVREENAFNPQNPPYPFFDESDGVVLFNFRMRYSPGDRTAARIYTYADRTATIVQGLIGIPQKRGQQDQQRFVEWFDSIHTDELAKVPGVTQHFIFTNGTESTSHGGPVTDNHEVELRKRDETFNNNSESAHADVRNVSETFSSAVEKSWVATAKDRMKRIIGRRHPIQLQSRAPTSANSTLNATSSSMADLERAREIVGAAMETSIRLNRARLSKPRRNHYGGTPSAGRNSQNTTSLGDQLEIRPLLALTEEIVDAAALVSEADALGLGSNSNVTHRGPAVAGGNYWMETIDRKGTVPWGNDPSYKVYRNVRDYGAVGDGKTDDTKAIKQAMNDGRRCGEKCNGSTTKNAIIYFPPGTYRVSSSIPLPFGTQVIGDAGNWPTIVAAPDFVGLGVLSTDEYTGGGKGPDGGDQQWFVNTANFYRQIRNLRIDITATRPAQQVACLHYQVAQATSIQNVELIAAPGSGQGIFAENGSGGVISDIVFRGGKFGIYAGNQQFTAQRLTFEGCETGVQIIWDWGWVWKSITMRNVQVGFRLLSEVNSGGHIGSVSVIDSSFQSVGTGILMAPLNSKPGGGSTGVIVDNVDFGNVAKAVADTAGAVLLAASGKIGHWVVGPVYSADGTRTFSTGQVDTGGFQRQGLLLDSKGAYFERAKPQYEGHSVSDFLHVKDFGARGDGTTDDTVAFQRALYASQGKILFVDAGSYILTNTITVPLSSKIVGETWSQLVASGSYFEDANHPKVLVKVGAEGDEGSIEMQDLLFTNRGPTAGLILVEWNVKASQPGSAALWDCHVRIGGATGTKLTPDECPPATSGVNPACQAASLMMHITPQASGYFENMWLWVADHMIDDPDLEDAGNDMVQTSIYVARGFLIESTEPVWLYGTASEHAVFYQYNFHHARNIFAGMIQTESPYYQPTPPPPAPFSLQVGLMKSDPIYKCGKDQSELGGCDESWAVIVRGSSNILVAGAGLYSWFSTYSQVCIDKHACQKVLMLLEDNEYNIRFQQLITIGAEYMAVQNGKGISALDNLNVETHPRWSQVSVFDVSTKNSGLNKDVWVDPKIWEMKNPAFTCTAPCTAVLPPWTAATSIVNVPLVTVSEGTWTSTITLPPMTVSEWVFRKITVSANELDAKGVRRTIKLMPTLEPTKMWPAIAYFGPDNSKSTMTPAPKTPPSIPTAFPKTPYPGDIMKWPDEPIMVIVHDSDRGPFAKDCTYLNQQGYCDRNQDAWDLFFGLLNPAWQEWFYDERAPEDRGPCPKPDDEEQESTPTPKPTSTKPPPLAHPSPRENKVSCRNLGEKFAHGDMSSGIDKFCQYALGSGAELRSNFQSRRVQAVRDMSGVERYVWFALGVKSGCEWQGTTAECKRYLLVSIDGCNCKGVHNKQGGLVSNNCINGGVWPGAKEKDAGHDEL